MLSVLTGGLTPVVKWNIRSHPHQYLFFNEIIGGIRGAFEKYETDYYGNSDRQAALWLNRFVEKQNLAKKLLVCSYSKPEQTQYYLNSKYILYNPEKRNTNACDVFIANLRWGVFPKGPVLHGFLVDGIPLVYIVLNDKRLKISLKK